jgi:hypothetical protein
LMTTLMNATADLRRQQHTNIRQQAEHALSRAMAAADRLQLPS